MNDGSNDDENETDGKAWLSDGGTKWGASKSGSGLTLDKAAMRLSYKALPFVKLPIW
jgi:hypothetical protein